MASYAVSMPSASVNGAPVLLGTTATTLHTAVAGTDGEDEVYVWVSNQDSASHSLTLRINAVTVLNAVPIPQNTNLQLVLPGVRLNNSLIVDASADAANHLAALVNVNRITN